MAVSVPLWYRRCLRTSKDVFHHQPSIHFCCGLVSRAGVVFSGLYLLGFPALAEGFCGAFYPSELPSPYIKYATSGKVLSRALLLDDGTEYSCNSRLAKHKTITSLNCGPLTLSWSRPFQVACLEGIVFCPERTRYVITYVLVDKNNTAFELGINNRKHNPSYSSDSSRVYRSDAVVETKVEKWGLSDTDRTIRLRTASECPGQHLPRPAL